MFALLHLRINEALGFLFMGIVASVILIKSKSLYATMIYHAFSNLTALLLGGFILPYVIDYIWIVFVVAVLGFVLFFILLLLQKNKMAMYRNFRAGTLVLNSLFSMPVFLSIVVVIIKYLLINVIG